MANTALLLRSPELWKPASALNLIAKERKFAEVELPALKKLFLKGLARGIIAEIYGRRSAGRTSLCLHILAQTTARGEICAVIDSQDSFDPASAQAAGVKLENLIWVRCRGNPEHAIRAADLFLHAGGFGVVFLDLCETSARVLNRIPLSYWYRFRKAVEHTPAVLLVCADLPQAKSCSSINLELKSKLFHWAGKAPFLLLRGLHTVALLRKRSALQTESLSIPSVA
jgi:hypothetical protein